MGSRWRGSFPFGVPALDGQVIGEIDICLTGSAEGTSPVSLPGDVCEQIGTNRTVGWTDAHTIELRPDGTVLISWEFTCWFAVGALALRDNGPWYLSPELYGRTGWEGALLTREPLWDGHQPIENVHWSDYSLGLSPNPTP